MSTNKSIRVSGEWQTEPYQPPKAENGVVPRNKVTCWFWCIIFLKSMSQYGHVDVFLPGMLPIGCVHMEHENIGTAINQIILTDIKLWYINVIDV